MTKKEKDAFLEALIVSDFIFMFSNEECQTGCETVKAPRITQ